jgi:hypothetical protein
MEDKTKKVKQKENGGQIRYAKIQNRDYLHKKEKLNK